MLMPTQAARAATQMSIQVQDRCSTVELGNLIRPAFDAGVCRGLGKLSPSSGDAC